MSEETKEAKVTMDGLVNQMQAAITAGDFKAVAKLAKDIAGLQAADEKAAADKRQNELKDLTTKVLNAMEKVVEKMEVELMDAKVDGVWYTHDNVEGLVECRLIKRKARVASSGGGGGGKRYGVSTTDLLAQFGGSDAGNGITYQQLWDSNTDKNSRYQLRVKMIKLAGITS